MIELESEGHKCSKCGISGIHACPGKPLPPPTPGDKERIRNTLQNLFLDKLKERKNLS